jgi:hypothetical protein
MLLQMFLCMKVLHLDDSKCLKEISDISSLQNLEEFSFQRCENLLTIHDSIRLPSCILNSHYAKIISQLSLWLSSIAKPD